MEAAGGIDVREPKDTWGAVLKKKECLYSSNSATSMTSHFMFLPRASLNFLGAHDRSPS